MAGKKATYSEITNELGKLSGELVRAQMRSTPGGDHLTIVGELGEMEMLADQGARFAIGDAGARSFASRTSPMAASSATTMP